MAVTVIDVIRKKLVEQQVFVERHLASGAVRDYPEYREVVGLLRGVRKVSEIVEESFKNAEVDQDD